MTRTTRTTPPEDGERAAAPSLSEHGFPAGGPGSTTPGAWWFGRYEVLAEIGRGSLGRVYRAFDPFTRRAVAIKIMRTADLPARTLGLYRRRFRMEAQAAGGLAHPNIVRIYDEGDDYLVMEFLEGKLLSRRLRERKMGLDEALSILAGVGAALDHAHAHGVVHRDVKPRNIVLLEDGTPKLTDFGLAVSPGGDATVGGKFLGHPSYMAPEHIVEGRATARSDLFSLGAIAYEMITGQRCFPGRNVGAVIHRVVYDEPVPVSRINRCLPPAYDEIFGLILQKDAARRPDSAHAFVQALARHKVARPASPRRRRGARTGGSDPRAQKKLDVARPTLVRGAEPLSGLAVRTDPVGATVWIDGVHVGCAPLELAPLGPGAHAVRIIAEGFVPVQMTIEIGAGTAVLVTLQPLPQIIAPAAESFVDRLERAMLRSLGRPS
jgi:serine/threonine protein kinase